MFCSFNFFGKSIFDKRIKQTIQDLMEIQLADNVKARIIDEKHRNKYIKPKGNKLIQSQLVTHQYIKDN